MKGFIRIAFTIWVCAALGQAFTLLAFFNGLQETRQAEVVRQLQTMVTRVQGPAAARAALGFPIEFDSRFQTLIDGLSESAKQVGGAIYIVDAQGDVVFSSDQSMVGAAAPAAWTAPNEGGGANWIRTTADETLVGAPITNGFSAKVGMIVARSLHKNLAVDVVSALRMPAAVAVLFLLLAAVQALFAVLLVSRPLVIAFGDMVERYQTATAGAQAGGISDLVGATSGIKAASEALAAMARIEEEGRGVDSVLGQGTAEAAAGEPVR